MFERIVPDFIKKLFTLRVTEDSVDGVRVGKRVANAFKALSD